MPNILVPIRADQDGKVQAAYGPIAVGDYRKLFVRQHGEVNVSPVFDNSFTVRIQTPLPVKGAIIAGDGKIEPGASVAITDEVMQQMADDPEWFHICCMMSRPGCYLFMRKLELEHYRPSTPKNNLYNIIQTKWQGLDWIVVTVPIGDRELAERVARECGMAFEDGVPHIVHAGGVHRFPMSSPTVFSLRNGSNSMAYSGVVGAEMTREAELEAVQRLERDQMRWLKDHEDDV